METPGARSRVRRLVWSFALSLAAAVALLLIAVAIRLRPVPRERAVARMEKRFDQVELESLDVYPVVGLSFPPRIAARGKRLSLSLPGRDDAPPFVTMTELEVQMGLVGLLLDPVRIRKLDLDELVIQIPPKREGADKLRWKESAPPPFEIGELTADGTVLRILPKDPRKEPLRFDLHQLRVKGAGIGAPMAFEAVLQNAKPPGEIETRGSFGPLKLDDAGSTPVSGEFDFRNADLSVFGGIGGTLHSAGRFGGALARIEVSGSTETPDFQLKSAGRPTRLRTEYRAIVDGTNGDTLLQPVNAILGETSFEVEGGVVDEPGPPGKLVCLDARTSSGRIGDFLTLVMKRDRPIMTGGIRFDSKIVIPSGDEDVVKRMVLEGTFSMSSVRFTEGEIQKKIRSLSETGRGLKGGGDAASNPSNDERVLSDIDGRFHLEDGVMKISYVSFAVPGAKVTLRGTYDLVSEAIDFHGELRLDAELSETTTGVKSFFLQLVDPLFRKRDAGAVIPIRIGGTPDDPDYGVEIGRMFTRKEVAPESKSAVLSWPIAGESCSALAKAYRASGS
jgi:AsmA-like C-terminal region